MLRCRISSRPYGCSTTHLARQLGWCLRVCPWWSSSYHLRFTTGIAEAGKANQVKTRPVKKVKFIQPDLVKVLSHSVGLHAALSLFTMKIVTTTLGFYTCFPSDRVGSLQQIVFKNNNRSVFVDLDFKQIKSWRIFVRYQKLKIIWISESRCF